MLQYFIMENDNKLEELLRPLQIPFTTQLTESNDEFRHAHGFFECFYVTEGSIYHECNGKKETLTEGDAGIICPGVYHRFKRDIAWFFFISKRENIYPCSLLKDLYYLFSLITVKERTEILVLS